MLNFYQKSFKLSQNRINKIHQTLKLLNTFLKNHVNTTEQNIILICLKYNYQN